MSGQPSLVQYWHTKDMPGYIAELLQSFSDLNPDLRHLVFDEREAEEFIAERFTDRELAAFRACAVPALQSDYFRFCAIFALGGVYADADFRCVAGLRSLVPGAGEGRLFRRREGNVVSNIFAFGSPGHPFLELALEIATVNIERRFPDRHYFVAAAPVFVCLVESHRLGSFEALLSSELGARHEEVLRSYFETIGDYARVERALEGVEVAPTPGLPACISPQRSLPYKKTDAHWTNFKGEIFR